ncbi:hypothetical protein PS659_02819 [Pseudomonas fluorescens]|uniref:Uncharacterized protein n=1 Tax=Pseudomonas fluorescens TaxID=294 RepID=A0A5E6TBM8_PSEFL|nr:hypothetical protein PS659_02819 [Pseudomonas fluorescens]
MGVNDYAFLLEKCVAPEFIASKLAPTRELWITQFFLTFSGRFQPSMFF